MKKIIPYLLVFFLAFSLLGCDTNKSEETPTPKQTTKSHQDIKQDNNVVKEAVDQTPVYDLSSIPAYTNKAYVALDQNVPTFEDKYKNTNSFESYGPLDSLGRCTQAFANVSLETMPTQERGSIGQVKPTGWHTIKYDCVDGKYLYNRCHLIGYQLTAENANPCNLITGTRYLNIDGMLLFENMVADYIKETKHHVLYRVTPVFQGQNLLASGVIMEGYSVEDQGQGISFRVYAYNVQPNITINYATGDSALSSSFSSSSQVQSQQETPTNTPSASSENVEIRANKNSKIYHVPGGAYYNSMADSKNLVIFHSEQEAIQAGYRKSMR